MTFASNMIIYLRPTLWKRLETLVSALMKKDLIALLPRLRRFACSLTLSVSDADDLVQEACLRALSRSDQWKPDQPFDFWMFRLTRNLWISEIRKQKVRFGKGQIPAEESAELVQHDTGEDRLAAVQLLGRVGALPSELAVVLVAVSVEGYSYSETAELLDIPIGTVMSRVHRARKMLAHQIAAQAEGVE
ncbi:RNA polymerase sigma-70 factor, ECF subfamily [Epibacterium ulvae]|uniref:RNA polymerase sigma-70 factor, ECF subfamily n=1 Tax=Epibacterium ulvae TaxID=1156985 RepID=A0A1G5R9Z5_9RHOB|nr:RNA polymerase sigma factor [Epibacterium ulvae]SCZ70877.1 RNA polymerase sigma-70 factor, ECF subfamily [Epibacterium ulvae]